MARRSRRRFVGRHLRPRSRRWHSRTCCPRHHDRPAFRNHLRHRNDGGEMMTPKLFYSIEPTRDREGNELWDVAVMEEGTRPGHWGRTVWEAVFYDRDAAMIEIETHYP